ncbi:MAG: bifunctional pyr operon transcriptional regulator/uracil phosphoribosyltransferase PyrR [Deltaproteobacteria bacterium]|jgi:pyrimidine operon attenuation protein/uracil phosphoribosyltransferase|nr:bifunctional pyr operon transcriptional regulator/uracil phosphoribosyltransferase PyrR [Deltaproteobacteria bacterium]
MMNERVTIYGPEDVEKSLRRMSADILRRKEELPVMVGIRRGGVNVSDRLQEIIKELTGEKLKSAIVDINFYRDDWSMARSFPKVGPTQIPFSLEGKRIILVDDVLYTGRTVRAALDALSEFGRASSIELAVLVDRGHRQMPIKADYSSFNFATEFKEIVEVNFTDEGRFGEIVLMSDRKL